MRSGQAPRLGQLQVAEDVTGAAVMRKKGKTREDADAAAVAMQVENTRHLVRAATSVRSTSGDRALSGEHDTLPINLPIGSPGPRWRRG